MDLFAKQVRCYGDHKNVKGNIPIILLQKKEKQKGKSTTLLSYPLNKNNFSTGNKCVLPMKEPIMLNIFSNNISKEDFKKISIVLGMDFTFRKIFLKMLKIAQSTWDIK